jgi:putative membrane protein
MSESPPPRSSTESPVPGSIDDTTADPAAAGTTPATREPSAAKPPRRTRAGATWVGISIAVLVMILLIVFIAQNTHKAKISFLWLDGSFPVGLALLVAAVAGALIAIISGSTRILQLRQSVRKHRGGGRGRRG